MRHSALHDITIEGLAQNTEDTFPLFRLGPPDWLVDNFHQVPQFSGSPASGQPPVVPQATDPASLSDAEASEYFIEHVFGLHRTGDFPDGG